MSHLSRSVQNLEASQTLLQTQRARAMRAAGIDVVTLTAGEPSFPTPDHIKEAGIRAIRENHSYYTANQGTPALISAVRRKFEEENGLHFEPSQILVSTGAKQAIFNLLCAILNPGDEAMIISPFYVSYPSMVRLAGGTPRIVSMRKEDGYRPNAELLRAALTPNTRLLLLNSPANPNGTVTTRGEMEEIARFAREAGLTVISDEVYEKILYDGHSHVSIGSLDGMADRVVTVNSMSKTYAMPGWRIGYLGGPADIVKAAGKVQGQITNNANAVAQEAARAALLGGHAETVRMLGEYVKRRGLVMTRLAEIPGIRLAPPQGAFYAFFSLEAYLGRTTPDGKTVTSGEEIVEYLLEKHHVAVVGGGAFGVPECIRLSFSVDEQTLSRGLERIARGLAELKNG
jgi:aspartate aminotransferase